MKKHLRKYGFWYLIFLYLSFRLWNLTLLPVFNDEAIYLNWGSKEIHTGNLYYSLYDAKQPLLMWFFGIFEDIFYDPLFAGRVVAVLTGLATMIGIYTLAKRFFSRSVALLAAGIYIITPLISFYDRQALMESAIAAIGVWEVYIALLFWQKPERKYPVFFGILAGIGFFIKSSSLLFVVAFLVTTIITKKWKNNITNIGFLLLAMLCVDSLLLINPEFWQTLPSNSRYSLTLGELLHFPIIQWAMNLEGNIEILFFYFTPLLLLFIVIGTVILFRKKTNTSLLLLIFLPILFEIILSRATTQRYFVSFTPLLVILTSIGLLYFYNGGWIKKGTVGLSLALAVIVTLLQLTSPLQYFQLFSSMTRLSDKEGYISSQLSGYGVTQAVSFLRTQSMRRQILVATALNSGNPEDAVQVYLANDPNVAQLYLDQSLFGSQLTGVTCLQADKPVYFISRDEQQGGLNAYFQQVTSIRNPYGTNRIGIYTLKQHCKGKTIRLD